MDYRYFPEPDLPPLLVDEAWVEELRGALPELPQDRRKRFIADHGLPSRDAAFLTLERPLADYFEAAARGSGAPRTAANWISGELTARLNAAGVDVADSPVSAEALAGLIRLIEDGMISGKIAKGVFEEMFETGGDASTIVQSKGLRQITDEGAIEAVVSQVVAENPSQVAQYRSGKTATLGWFVGQVMKKTQGKANPGIVNGLLKKRLQG